MSKAKSIFSPKRQYNRSKKFMGMTNTIAGAFRAMHRIGAFKEPPRDKLPPYVQTFCRKMAGSFGVEVIEVETVPKVHALWVSNHVSWMDIPVVGTVSRAFFLSKAEIGEWPVFGALVKASGNLFIKRGSGDSNAVIDQMTDFLKAGHSVSIFPEAGTTNGKRIKRIHGKLLKAAINAGVPIQPIVICYVNKDGTLNEEVPYYGKQTMKESINKVLDSHNVKAHVLPLEAIETDGLTPLELGRILQANMEKGLAELHYKVLNKKSHTALQRDIELEIEAEKLAAQEKEAKREALKAA